MLARLTGFITAVFLFSLFSAPPSFAQSTATPAAIPATVSPTSPLYTDLLLNNMMHTFSCLIVGQSFIQQPCLTYQEAKNAQGLIQTVPVLSSANLDGGALGAVTGLISGLYQNPPLRTADYVASVGRDIGIIKTANAQVIGSGAGILSPILALWQTSRNIAYVLLIIIFLIIGLMIMFRNKINPQTVISAQAALPGLIIGLVMITFSYFFAGLISDMAFVGTNIVGYYFVAAQGQLNSDDPEWQKRLNLSDTMSDQSILSVMAPMTGIVTRERAYQATQGILDKLGDAITPIRIVVFWLTSQFMMPFAGIIPLPPPLNLLIGPLVSLGVGGLANIALPDLLSFFISLAAALALTYQMIKLLFKLIMAWLTIIFLTISAPFQLLVASLPGRQGMATGWIMNLLGNILIFPAVVAVLYFVVFLIGPSKPGAGQGFEGIEKQCPQPGCPFKVSLNKESALSSAVFAADEKPGPNDIIGNATFPLMGGMDFGFVKIILAFGALMALPVIPDLVVKSVGKAGQAGQAVGHEIMGGFGQGQGYAKRTYMAGVGYGQETGKNLFGEPGGPVWNPNKTDAQGNVVGGFDWPRRPGYFRR